MKFQLNHIASLCKYTGISFIAGAITHGSFSTERSLWTALFGVVLYLTGSTLTKFANPEENHSWTGILIVGILASIGLGFFTGGLQHFLDSPGRSVWVVPAGFLMSLIAVFLMERENIPLTKPIVYYAIIGGGIVIAASAFAYLQLDDHDGHHDGDHHHEHSSAPAFIKHQSPGG